MSETPAEMIKALEDRISGRIKELHDELKHHCDIADARMRDNEHDIIENNVLLEQFVDMQQKQNETNEKLNNTLGSLNSSIGTMEKSIKELFKRTEKADGNIGELQVKTAVIPELKTRIEENEAKHKIDLRDVDKEIARDQTKKWKTPVVVGASVVGGGGLIALLVKIIELGSQIIEKLPPQ
jgi:hypothetical protein